MEKYLSKDSFLIGIGLWPSKNKTKAGEMLPCFALSSALMQCFDLIRFVATA